jgi:hypothetical protein
MKTASAKAKGRTFQQWVRDEILSNFPSLNHDDVRSTSMGAAGEDILLSKAARKRFPYSVECKSRRGIAVYSWLDQREADGSSRPIVFAKGNHKEPIVILYASDFFNLVKEKSDT